MKKICLLILMLIFGMGSLQVRAEQAVPASNGPIVYTPGGRILVRSNASKQHYEAFQIFAADEVEDGALINVRWGNGIDSGDFVKAYPQYANLDTVFEELQNDPVSFARIFNSFLIQNAFIDASGFLKPGGKYPVVDLNNQPTNERGYMIPNPYQPNSTTLSNQYLQPGYYLIKNTAAQIGPGSSYSFVLCEVGGEGMVTINPKDGAPSLNKQVLNENGIWDHSASAAIGQIVDFRCTITLPKSLVYYETYGLRMTDTLPPGLDMSSAADAISVQCDGFEWIQDVHYTFSYDADKKQYLFVFGQGGNLLNTPAVGANKQIVVRMKMRLNEQAYLAPHANTNTAQLFYSNDPMNSGGTTYEDPKGETNNVTANVYTFAMQLEKVDEQSQPLAGARLQLFRLDASNQAVEVTNSQPEPASKPGSSAANVFSWTGLGPGSYFLNETQTPEGYDTIQPLHFTISANYGITSPSSEAVLTGITVNQVGTDQQKFQIETNDEGIMIISRKIVDEKGSLLPETGTPALALMIAGGLMLLGIGLKRIFHKASPKSAGKGTN